ncbi:MAG TPA: hypothetical protein VF181_07945 [Balneolaceae bacterium]
MSYLVEIEGNKEDEAVNRLFAKNKSNRIPFDQSLEDHFDVKLSHCIVGLRIPFHYIDKNLNFEDKGKLEGDIDIFFVQLTANIHDFFKPIDFDLKDLTISAFEVKVGYYNSEQKLKSTGLFPGREKPDSYSDKQFKFRNQAAKLCELGFDKVGLMYAIPAAPSSWNISSYIVTEINKKVGPKIYVDEKDRFSTFHFPIGTILGRQEHESGVLTDFKFKHKAVQNSIENLDFQQKLKSKIEAEFPFEVNPNDLPILFLACRSCENLYLSASDPYKFCPECGSKPINKFLD